MAPKLLVISVAFLLLHDKINCTVNRVLYVGAPRSRDNNWSGRDIGNMKEDDSHNAYLANLPGPSCFPYFCGFYDFLFRYPIAPFFPYRYSTFNRNRYLPQNYKVQTLHSHEHKHYLDRLPPSLTYEVTHNINMDKSEVPTESSLESKDQLTPTVKKDLTHPTTDSNTLLDINEDNNGIVKVMNEPVEVQPLEGPHEEDAENDPDDTVNNIQKRLARTLKKRDIADTKSLKTNAHEIKINITEYLTNLFENIDQDSFLDLMSTLKHKYLLSATPEETGIIDDIFFKIVTIYTNRKISQDIVKKKIDARQKAEMITDAAAMLELLAEESTISNSTESFLGDESYHDYSNDKSQENTEDNGEPSLMELVSIISKQKTTKSVTVG